MATPRHAADPVPQDSSPPEATPLRSGALTTIDQVLSSASNALLIFALAQVCSPGSFGAVSMLIVLSTTFLGFNRGALGTPLLLVSNLRRDVVAVEAGYAVTWSIATGVVTSAALWGVGWWMGEPAVGLALALSMPAVLAQDVLRFCAVAQGRPQVAVLCDGAWVAVMLVIYGVNLAGDTMSAEATIALWGAAGLLSAVVLGVWLQVVPRVRQLRAWWNQYSRARARFGFGQAVSQVGATAVTFVATIMVDTVAAAGLRGAAAAFGPIAMLISALPMVFLPHSRTSGSSLGAQWRLLRKTALIASALTLVAAALLEIVPRVLGEAVLGETWPHSRPLIPYVALECAAMCWVASVYSLLQALGRSRAVMRLKVFQMVMQLGLSIGAGAVFGSALAIAVALAVCGVATAVAGVGMVAVVLRRHPDQEAADAASLQDAPPATPVRATRRSGRVRQYWPNIDVLDAEKRADPATTIP